MRWSATFGAIANWRICPECSREAAIDLVSCFRATTGCARHGLAYLEACRCGAAIRPFAGQQPAFTCHSCGVPYADLVSAALSAADRAASVSWASFIEALRARSGDRAEHTAADLCTALRLIAHRAPTRERTGWRYNHRSLPTLAHIHDVLQAYGRTVTDFLAVVEEARTSRTAGTDLGALLPGRLPKRPEPSDAEPPPCPNPICGARNPYRQGRQGHTGRRQYACRVCATTYNSVKTTLFSYDDLPTIPAWRTLANRRQLDEQRLRVLAVAKAFPAERYLQTSKVFDAARVPKGVRAYTPRAGLVAIVEEVARERGLLTRRKGINRRPMSRRAKDRRIKSAHVLRPS